MDFTDIEWIIYYFNDGKKMFKTATPYYAYVKLSELCWSNCICPAGDLVNKFEAEYMMLQRKSRENR